MMELLRCLWIGCLTTRFIIAVDCAHVLQVTKPMLQWMVNTLKPGNVLTSEELQQWQKLQESDQTLEVRT